MAKIYKRKGVWYGTADDMVLMIEKQKTEIDRLRECLERLASRHVKSKPLWWQQMARDALSPKEPKT